MIDHADIIHVLSKRRFNLDTEKTTQAEIAAALADSFPGVSIVREYALDGRSEIDLLVDVRIGIEVKIKGAKREIYRQCERYCQFAQIEIFILITNRSMGFPKELNGKSCYVVKLGQAWL
jgi:hypothetical protein